MIAWFRPYRSHLNNSARNWQMRIEKVVINSSPLIVLFRSGQADLLPQLFRDIVVPESVYKEVLAGREDDAALKR